MEQGGLYLSYTKYFFIYLFFTFIIRHFFFFSFCFLRCVENFETKVACERCCLWEGLFIFMYVQGSIFFWFSSFFSS